VLTLVLRGEVNVCRPVCAAGEFEFADVARELEPLLADALPMRAFVPVACHFVGAARVFLPLVLGAVAALAGPAAFGAGSEWHYAGTGSASTRLRLASCLACAARPPRSAQAVSMPVGSLVSLSYLQT
jgi:hypothetical protein